MRTLTAFALGIGLIMATGSYAQAPAGTTGVCKDGTYTSAATKRGACAGHGGVKEWSAEKAEAAPTTTTAPAAPAQPAAKAEATRPSTSAEKSTATAKSANAMPAAGGGSGQVWVNAHSKVYHCSGTKWYGKTKQGEYMTEAAAKAAGNHADHGKACS